MSIRIRLTGITSVSSGWTSVAFHQRVRIVITVMRIICFLSLLCIPADHIHRIKGENEPGTEAMRYSWVVKEFLPLFNQMPTFDCIILGVGEDSHTASIFPTTMELLSDSRNYAVSQQPSTGQYRITMTGPLILNGAPYWSRYWARTRNP